MNGSAPLALVSALTLAAAATLLLKVTLVLAAGTAVAALLRRRSAATRHEVWKATLLAAIVLPLLAPLAPSIALAWLPASAGSSEPAAAPPHATLAGPRQRSAALPPAVGNEAGLPAVAAAPAPAVAPHTLDVDGLRTTTLVVAAWALGSLAVMLWCFAGHLGLRRLAHRAQGLGGDGWHAMLADAAARAGVRRRVRLRASPAVGTPVTWGGWRPVVVLPAEAERWPAERRRAALLHELAHVARHDYLTQLAGTAACALYWFHPAAWMALRRLRQESERACDDRVLVAGAAPAEYAAQLLAVAQGARALRLGGAALAIGMARPSTLEGRLLAVLDTSVPRRSVPRGARLAGAVAVALALVPFAGLTPVARGAMTPHHPIPASPRQVVATGLQRAGGAGLTGTSMGLADDEGGGEAEEGSAVHASVAASPGEELHLDLETGAGVSISGWDEPRVEVGGRLAGRDWRDSRVEATREGHGVLVRIRSVRHFGSESTSHRLVIHVPRRFDVRLQSAGGELVIDGVEGTFRGSTGGGGMELTHLHGHAELSTGGGEIEVSDSTLSGSVSTGGGMVRFSGVGGGLHGSSGSGPVIYREPAPGSDVTGDLGEVGDSGGLGHDRRSRDRDRDDDEMPADATVGAGGTLHISRAGGEVRLPAAPDGAVIDTGGGDVTVGRGAGLVAVSTGGGDIEVGPVAGSVRAGTGAGRVEITLEDARGGEQTVDVRSGSGAVLLVLPSGFRGTFDLETAYTESFGRATRITVPWELQRQTTGWDDHEGTPRRYVRARGDVGGGGGRVRVKTVNGDIEVRQSG